MKTKQIILYLLSALMIGYGGYNIALHFKPHFSEPELPSANIVHDDSARPEESDVNYSDYQVPADQPRLIRLDSISAIGPIQRVGLNQQGAIAAPSNIGFAGWYVDSVKPGDNGLSIIDGHVSGRYRPGIFSNLDKLSQGDLITVEYGDGSTRNFEVVDSRTLPTDEAAAHLLRQDPDIDSQLNLITCDGAYNSSVQQYDKRLIVTTKLLP